MGKDADEIRHEIEQTRERLGETVEAITYKADVPSRVRESISDRVETVKQRVQSGVETVKDKLSGAGSTVSDRLDDAKSGAGGALGSVTGAVSGAVGNVTGAVTDKLPSASQVRRGLENPIGVVIGAAALGFLAGLILPVTDIERQKLQPLTDDLAERVGDVREQVVDAGQQVIKETLQAAQSSAQQHGQEVVGAAMGSHSHSSTSGTSTSGATSEPNLTPGVGTTSRTTLDDDDLSVR